MAVQKLTKGHAGALRYALARLRGIVRPPVEVYEPAPGSVIMDQDLPVAMRDGATLRVNLYRPPGAGPFPVLVAAHPYGKDRLPRRTRRGRYRYPTQYRTLRQTGTVRFSSLTTWEAPDPAWWTAQGYAVVNADLRGAGTSDGVTRLLSRQEGEDVHDLVEWAGAQPWSTGRVGLLGVSYLAICQYHAAALRPPSLAAICPWEGFTDVYRDLFRPGGIAERGFVRTWSAGVRSVRSDVDLQAEQQARPLRDTFWQELAPDLAGIEVPMLVCASFSDNNLHSRGSWRAFLEAGSSEVFAYTHREGKWAAFYGEPARRAQLAFFERYLRGRHDVPPPPRVRLEVRDGRQLVEVRPEDEYPLARTRWTKLHLGAGGLLLDDTAAEAGCDRFHLRREAATFAWTAPGDIEVVGPLEARLWVDALDADDVDLVVGVEVWRAARPLDHEGSFGWGRDRLSTGWQRASLRALDDSASRPGLPVHTFDRPAPLGRGEVVEVPVALGHVAARLRAGDVLRFVVAGRWLSPSNPLTGQFPAHYATRSKGVAAVHWSPDRPSHLLVPFVAVRP